MPVLLPAEPHLGPDALGVAIAPFRHRDRGRPIDEQTCVIADRNQVSVVIRQEPGPALEVDLATQRVTLVSVAATVCEHEVVGQVARVA